MKKVIVTILMTLMLTSLSAVAMARHYSVEQYAIWCKDNTLIDLLLLDNTEAEVLAKMREVRTDDPDTSGWYRYLSWPLEKRHIMRDRACDKAGL